MKSLFHALALCSAVLMGASAMAQPAILWRRAYGGARDDVNQGMARAQDGGFVLSGSTNSFVPDSAGIYLVKTDPSGTVEWSSVCGGPVAEWCHAVTACSDGGFITAGETWSFGPGLPDYPNIYLIKFTSNGDTAWTRVFGGVRDDVAYGVQTTSDGGYAVAGYTESFGVGAPHANMFLLKLDADGDSLWMHTYGDSVGQEYAWSLHRLDSGGYVLGGATFSGPGGGGALVVKTDNTGLLEWSTRFIIEQQTEIHAVCEVPGGVVVSGITLTDSLSRECKMFLAKLDVNGDTVWTRAYSGQGDDLSCYDVQVTLDGGFILAGGTDNPYPFQYYGNSYLIRTDSAGNVLWRGQYGQEYDDEAHAVLVLEDGGYAVAGTKDGPGRGADYFLLRTERDPALDIHDRAVPAPLAFQVSAFPNPFNGETTIALNVPPGVRQVTLGTYNLLGQLVARDDLVALPGPMRYRYHAQDLSSGLYLLRVEAGSYQTTQKLMLLR